MLLIAGTDDAKCLAGIEYAASSVPNAKVESVPSGHFPKSECSRHYQTAFSGGLLWT